MHSTPPPSPPARPRVHAEPLAGDGLQTIRTLCEQRGFVFTAMRQRVLQVLADAGVPMKAYAVLEEVRRTQPNAAPTSVYRALDFLLGQGWAVRLNSINAHLYVPPGTPSRCTYLVCEECCSVQVVHGAETGVNWMDQARITGFVPASHSVEISGRCAGCRTADASRGT